MSSFEHAETYIHTLNGREELGKDTLLHGLIFAVFEKELKAQSRDPRPNPVYEFMPYRVNDELFIRATQFWDGLGGSIGHSISFVLNEFEDGGVAIAPKDRVDQSTTDEVKGTVYDDIDPVEFNHFLIDATQRTGSIN